MGIWHFNISWQIIITLSIIQGDGSTFVVSWTTMDKTEDSQVDFGTDPSHLNETFKGSQERFVDGGHRARTEYIHRAVFPVLASNQRICESH